MREDIRWQQRFQNFDRAFSLLREIVTSSPDIITLEPIVKEGIIIALNILLNWDGKPERQMIDDGLVIERISPKHVFRTAWQAKYIDTIEPWLEMTDDRNLMSHTYDFNTFDEVLARLATTYFPLLQELHGSLARNIR